MQVISERKNIMGGSVFWTLTHMDLTSLRKRLSDIGLDKYAPARRAPGAAMKSALAEKCKENNVLIRPMDGKNHFGVYKEERGLHSNDYPLLMSARLCDDDTFDTYNLSSYEFRLEYERQLTIADPATSGRIMTKICTEALDGVALRDSGGLYWIPQFWMKTLDQVDDAFRRSKYGDGTCKLYVMETGSNDPGAVEAVKDNLASEVEACYREWTADLTSGDKGLLAINTIRNKAEYMATKLAAYSKILNTAMDESTKLIEQVEHAVAAAAIAATAKQMNQMAASA